jgi:hypothetical protein
MRLALLCLLAGLALLASDRVMAQALSASPQETTPKNSYLDETHQLQRLEQLNGVCMQIRSWKPGMADPRAALQDLKEDPIIMDGLAHFCTSGSLRISAAASDGKCEKPKRLNASTVDLLLDFWRSQHNRDGNLVLKCLELPQELRLVNFEANTLLLEQTNVESVFIAYSKLPSGINISDSTIKHGLGIYEGASIGLIDVQQTTIGKSPTWQLAFGAVDSAIDGLWIRGSTIDGDIDLTGVTAKTNIDINNKSKVNGELNAAHGHVGGYLQIHDSAISEGINCPQLEADRVLILQTEFKSADFDEARVARSFTLEGGKHELLTMWRMHAEYVSIHKVELAQKISATGMVAGEVNIADLKTNNLFLDNSRLQIVDVGTSTLADFYCTDCVVEHYMLLADDFSKGAWLDGARISGALVFSNDDTHASWGKGSMLSLVGVHAQTIEAFDEDLRVKAAEARCPGELVNARLTGMVFDHLVGGRHSGMGTTEHELLKRNVRSIANWLVGKRSCSSSLQTDAGASGQQPSRSAADFDPEPFEIFANAFARSGRTEDAVELRILERDLEVEQYHWWKWALYKGARAFVSYGYENWRAIFWFACLLLLGAVVHLFGRRKGSLGLHDLTDLRSLRMRLGYSLFFSLDRMVPHLALDHRMDEYSALRPEVRFYFYLHRVLGMIIFLYAIAGWTGVLLH